MIRKLITHPAAILLAIAAIAIAVTYMPVQHAAGSTLSYQTPNVATSSSIQVGPQAITRAMATSSACTARTISTTGSAITITFSGNALPGGSVGHVQAASTTVNYDNGGYGCGSIYIFGYASSTVTMTEVD